MRNAGCIKLQFACSVCVCVCVCQESAADDGHPVGCRLYKGLGETGVGAQDAVHTPQGAAQ